MLAVKAWWILWKVELMGWGEMIAEVGLWGLGEDLQNL